MDKQREPFFNNTKSLYEVLTLIDELPRGIENTDPPESVRQMILAKLDYDERLYAIVLTMMRDIARVVRITMTEGIKNSWES